MAAAGLADIGAGDPHPLEVRRVGQHPLEQLAVASLELGPLVERQARLADPLGKFVAHPLQLAEAEHPRLAATAAHRGVDLDPAEGLGEQPGQLVLEPGDLAPQLGAGKALVAPDPKRKRVSRSSRSGIDPARV